MKKFFEEMLKDYQEDGFSRREWIVYGVIAPVALILVCLLSELINVL